MVYVVMKVQSDDYSGFSRLEMPRIFATREAAQGYLDIWKSPVNELYIREEILRVAP
jgi:hypothetical protein